MQRYVWMAGLLYFSVDAVLLMGANQLCGFPQSSKRIILAATVGAAYALLCLKPGFHFLGNLFWRTVSLALIAVIAFGLDSSSLRRGFIFAFLQLAMLGILDGRREGFWQIVLAVSVVFLLSMIGFGDGAGRQYLPIQIEFEGKTARFTALRDTGNCLQDPLTGESVLVVSPKVGEALLGIPISEMADPVKILQEHPLPGLRLIPYRTIGNSTGLLLAMRFGNVRLGEKVTSQTVAFSPQPIGEGKTFQALAGGNI